MILLILERVGNLKRGHLLLYGVSCGIIVLIRSGMLTELLYRLAGSSNAGYISKLSGVGYGFLLITTVNIFLAEYFAAVAGRAQRSGRDVVLFKRIEALMYASVLLIPLYSINVLFFRLFRSLMVFGYLVCAERFVEDRELRQRWWLLFALLLFVMLYDANGIGSIVSVLGMS